VLWLLPIHPVGEKNRKGKLGSPYSVRDYYGINPEFGTLQDFKRLLSAVHKNGMKLIIDLVANHTAWDSKLVLEHPEWYTKDLKGALVQPNADWTDVADLDYSQSGLRKYMIEMMRWWVKDIGIDGFRCDVAELVPTDFWEEAREKLNRIKPVMMLSEGSIPEHSIKAFDLTYSWNVYDALDPLLRGKRAAAALDEIFMMERMQYPTGALRMRFNTNHDKNAWDMPAVLKYGKDGLKLTAVLVHTIPGVPMIYTGEEAANDRKLSLFEKVDVDWSRSREMGKLYRTLSLLRRDHKALSRGELLSVPSSIPQDIYAFFRIAGSDKILTVLNFAPEPRLDTLAMPIEKVFPGESNVVLKDIFSGQRMEIGPDVGGRVAVALEPRGFKVFVMDKK
jgi:glycosidase